MIIFRYLVKEVLTTVAGLTSILLLIFMSNQFMRYLSRAASGSLPGAVVFKLMALEIPNLLGLLLPLGFYVAILIAYGRLYAENEMTVMQACGYSPRQLLKHTLIMALVVATIVTGLMLWVAPVISTGRAKLIRTQGVQTMIQTIVPQRFRAISGGKQVFYVEEMSRDHDEARNIFLAQQKIDNDKLSWKILWAESGHAAQADGNDEQYIVLNNGREYEGVPGQADFQVAEFKQYQARLPHQNEYVSSDMRTLPTSELWPINNPDRKKAAEIQWRISVPIMVLVLTLLAVPLSKVNPRQDKYAKLLPAIIIYILYANLMFVGRDWLVEGKVPVWLGFWWLHASFALLGIGAMMWSRLRSA